MRGQVKLLEFAPVFSTLDADKPRTVYSIRTLTGKKMAPK